MHVSVFEFVFEYVYVYVYNAYACVRMIRVRSYRGGSLYKYLTNSVTSFRAKKIHGRTCTPRTDP